MGVCSMCRSLMIALLLMVSIIRVINMAEGQTIPPCGENIFPCLNYINYTHPPKSCCTPLKNMYANQKTCVCQLVFTTSILQGLGVTIPQALKLGRSCGLNITENICKAELSSRAPSSSLDPQANLGGEKRVPVTGLSFVMLFWTYVLYN